MKSRKFSIKPDGFMWSEDLKKWIPVEEGRLLLNCHRGKDVNTVNKTNNELIALKELGCITGMIHLKLKVNGTVLRRTSWSFQEWTGNK